MYKLIFYINHRNNCALLYLTCLIILEREMKHYFVISDMSNTERESGGGIMSWEIDIMTQVKILDEYVCINPPLLPPIPPATGK